MKGYKYQKKQESGVQFGISEVERRINSWLKSVVSSFQCVRFPDARLTSHYTSVWLRLFWRGSNTFFRFPCPTVRRQSPNKSSWTLHAMKPNHPLSSYNYRPKNYNSMIVITPSCRLSLEILRIWRIGSEHRDEVHNSSHHISFILFFI